MPVYAELLAKAARQLLQTELNTTLATIRAEWSTTQALSGWTVPADVISEFKDLDSRDIMLGSVNVVQAESNFPSVYIWVVDEVPQGAAEQNESGVVFRLTVRIFVNGLTTEHTDKLVYRYADGIRRTILNQRTLLGAGLDIDPPEVSYVPAEDQPLFKAAHMEFPVRSIIAW